MISITPEGVVLKDGEELGRIDGDTMIHHVPVGGVVKGQIRKAAQNSSLEFRPAPISDDQLDQVSSIRSTLTVKHLQSLDSISSSLGIPTPTTIVRANDIVQPGRKPRPALERMLAKAQAGEIPQPPPMGSEGDKTPSFIRWFQQYATPEEFEIQYGGRKYSLDPAPKQSNRLPGEFYES